MATTSNASDQCGAARSGDRGVARYLDRSAPAAPARPPRRSPVFASGCGPLDTDRSSVARSAFTSLAPPRGAEQVIASALSASRLSRVRPAARLAHLSPSRHTNRAGGYAAFGERAAWRARGSRRRAPLWRAERGRRSASANNSGRARHHRWMPRPQGALRPDSADRTRFELYGLLFERAVRLDTGPRTCPRDMAARLTNRPAATGAVERRGHPASGTTGRLSRYEPLPRQHHRPVHHPRSCAREQ